MAEPSPDVNFIAKQIVDCAFAVHQELGPGLLENVYEQCLAYEFEMRDINFKRQVPLAVLYKTRQAGTGYRIDVVVDEKVILEIKAVETILPIHEAQLFTYLKLSGLQLGLLINFNTTLIKNGIRRVVCTI
jgi:GxxExxY protein